MKKLISILSIGLLPVLSFGQESKLEAFPLQSVRLLESPFKQAQETDYRYIMAMNPDRLLAPFLREAGIEPKAPIYTNWENTGLDGHIGGHYLSALAKMYAATGKKNVQDRLTYMIDWLEKCQQQNGNGYVGGVPGSKKLWEDIGAGKINAGGFSLNEKWVPLYNIHKIYAGLVDAYLLAGNQKAKDMLVKLTDWCINLTKNLSDAQMQDMLRSEHGGLNEVFADVAAITGNQKYLELARRFSHQRILNPLLQQKDSLTGMHANTQIPKVIGYMRVAELTGDKAWESAANFFWNTVTQNRSVSIGGNSVREHFNPVHDFSNMIESREGPETCNSYNMLKLTKQLFLSQYSARYMDYYERTLYNHILSTQHPDGGFVYFTPMRPRHYRVYSQVDQGFWCCVGSGIENHGKYGELIYAHNKKDLFVNLFIPSTLTWSEQGIQVEQSGKFPFEERSQIKLTMNKPQNFALHVRKPSWVKDGGMKLLVNGKAVSFTVNDAGYAAISRQWKSGDVVTVVLPMQTKAEKLPDNSNWVSFVHGPIVLAAATDTTNLQGLRADDSRMGHIAHGPLYPIEEAPVLVSDQKNIVNAIKPVKGKTLTFTAANVYPQQFKNIELVPFFQIHDARYVIYWPFTTADSLELRNKAIQEQEKQKLALDAITVDQVAPGEQQPESDHNFKGERTETGVHRDRHWRNARGWFAYDLKNTNKEGRKLRITYFGDGREQSFDIFVNGTLLQTVKTNAAKTNEFYDVEYDLPAQVLQDAGNTINLKFAAHANSVTANIFYVRLLK